MSGVDRAAVAAAIKAADQNGDNIISTAQERMLFNKALGGGVQSNGAYRVMDEDVQKAFDQDGKYRDGVTSLELAEFFKKKYDGDASFDIDKFMLAIGGEKAASKPVKEQKPEPEIQADAKQKEGEAEAGAADKPADPAPKAPAVPKLTFSLDMLGPDQALDQADFVKGLVARNIITQDEITQFNDQKTPVEKRKEIGDKIIKSLPELWLSSFKAYVQSKFNGNMSHIDHFSEAAIAGVSAPAIPASILQQIGGM